MSLLDDLQTKADLNEDGKLNTEDIESLKDGINDKELDKLKDLADQNDDGKINADDLKNIDFGDIVDSAKDKFGDLFSGK